MTIFGIDVSGRTVDFHQAYAADVRFMFAEASLATTPNAAYAANVAEARAAGIIPGAYHFLYAHNGAAQCDAFLAAIGDPDGLLCAVDMESDPGSVPTLVDLADFVTRWRARTAHELIVYLPRWFYTGYIRTGTAAQYGPLWWSAYGGTATSIPVRYAQAGGDASPFWKGGYAGWTTTTFWQFAGTTDVPNVGRCDLDAFRGTVDDLRKLASSTGDPMDPASNAPGGTYDIKAGVSLYGDPGRQTVLVAQYAGARAVPFYFTAPLPALSCFRLNLQTAANPRFVLAYVGADALTPSADATPYSQADLSSASAKALISGFNAGRQAVLDAGTAVPAKQ